jgi:hypothetical protein
VLILKTGYDRIQNGLPRHLPEHTRPKTVTELTMVYTGDTPMEEPLKGSCFCGAIRFELRFPILFHVHCHCNYCRMAQGAAFVTWVGFEEEQFRYLQGGELITWYKSTRESRRGFCPTCGSTLFYRSSVSPGEIHIARPYITSPLPDLPDAHVFFDQRVDWFTIHDDLAKINSDHEGLVKYKTIGR